MVKGQIYTGIAFGCKYIIKYDYDKHSEYHLYFGSSGTPQFNTFGNFSSVNLEEFIEANYEDRMWLEKCAKKGYYVEQNLMNYEIY